MANGLADGSAMAVPASDVAKTIQAAAAAGFDLQYIRYLL
jgi:hypothetical protein